MTYLFLSRPASQWVLVNFESYWQLYRNNYLVMQKAERHDEYENLSVT
jgi:hypothetical protein